MRSWLLLLALSLLPARASAEGSTLPSEKRGACALLTVADAQRFSSVPMEAEVGAPGSVSPGRTCAYRPVRPGSGHGSVQLHLLDVAEWSHLKTDADSIEAVKGIGDEAYALKRKSARRAGAVVVFVRHGSSQFSVRFASAGLQLTDPMKQLARSVAARL